MKLTVVGAGVCASQIPNVKSQYPPGFVLEWGNEKILFECTEGIRFRLEQAGFQYADFHHIAISHLHPDHFALVHFVQSVFCHEMWVGKKDFDINVYSTKTVKRAYPELLKWQVPEIDYPEFLEVYPKPKFHLPQENPQQIGTGSLTATPVYHGYGLHDAVAFRLQTPEGVFVFSGDTGECEGIRKVCQNADIFLCEASARIGNTRDITHYGHLAPRLAGEIAKQGQVKKLVLFHYNGQDSDEAILKDARASGFEGEIILAKDYLIINSHANN